MKEIYKQGFSRRDFLKFGQIAALIIGAFGLLPGMIRIILTHVSDAIFECSPIINIIKSGYFAIVEFRFKEPLIIVNRVAPYTIL